MSFMDKLSETLNEDFNKSVTENGAVGYRTTGKELLDINFAVASLRSANEASIANRFAKAFVENELLAMKWLFFARDVRGGLGERRLFRTAIKWVSEYKPDIVKKVVELIPEYGRFDDLWCLLNDDEMRPVVIEFVKKQLIEDLDGYKNGQPISLLAKWLPSPVASSRETKAYAKIIRNGLSEIGEKPLSECAYRKMLSRLRKYLDVVEVKMSAREWGAIDYSKVPSRANLLYNAAFLRNDEERRRAFLDKLSKGETKINASTLYPHDIVHNYFTSSGWHCSIKKHDDETLESLWKSLPDTVKDCGNTIVVADGSGSMTTTVGNSKITALEVANALAIYFAERSSGQFKNKYITFSSRPQFVNFTEKQSLPDLKAFTSRYANARFYINENKRNAVVFVGLMNLRIYHFIQSLISRLLPWYFKDNTLSDAEKELVKSLTLKTATGYEKLIEEFAEKYDFRSAKIKKMIGGIANKTKVNQLQQVRNNIADYERKIEDNRVRFFQMVEAMQELRTRECGLTWQIDNAADDTELVEYFMHKKNINVLSASNDHIEFIVDTIINEYNIELYEHMRDETLEHQERYINKFVNNARQKREQQEQDKKNTQQDELENLNVEYADVIESEFLEVLNGI